MSEHTTKAEGPRWCHLCGYGKHFTTEHEAAVLAEQGRAWPPSTERKTPGPMERK